ncbi:MAG: cupin domain-containing protein [Sulfobacillus sp.]
MKVQSGRHYSAIDVGAWDALSQYHVEQPIHFRGKVFLSELLGLTGMEVSLNCLVAGETMPFTHRHHEHEELYVFVGGHGQFQVDDLIIPVHEGTAIRVSPQGERAWRNNSTVDLYYMVIQAKADSLTETTFHDGELVSNTVSWPE